MAPQDLLDPIPPSKEILASQERRALRGQRDSLDSLELRGFMV